jgi:hypothetical protein
MIAMNGIIIEGIEFSFVHISKIMPNFARKLLLYPSAYYLKSTS